MKTKHTALPWRTGGEDSVYTTQGDNRRIADCENTPFSKRPRPPVIEDKENAAFIVRACNNHYAFLDALKACMTDEQNSMACRNHEYAMRRIKAINEIINTTIKAAEQD